MESLMTTNWTEEEFKAYTLLYAAHANYDQSDEELEYILNKISPRAYKTVYKELEHDNDYQSIQKILYYIEKYHYSQNDIEKLVTDIRELFDADGEVDELEENMLLALKKLLH